MKLIKSFFDPQSDLIAFPVVLFTFAVFAATWAALEFGGALLALLVWIPIWAFVLVRLFSEKKRYPSALLHGPTGRRDQVLLVANHSLESEGLVREVGRIGRSRRSRVFVSIPIPPARWIDRLTDDLDGGLEESRHRERAFLEMIEPFGVDAEVREDLGAEPARALVDGLSECSVDEILLAPADGEPGWSEAEQLADRIGQRHGVPVIRLGEAVPLIPQTIDGASLDGRLADSFPASDPPGTY